MLNDLLNMLYPFTNGSITTSYNHSDNIDCDSLNKYKIETVNDARSATFFALGKSKNMFKPTVLLIDDQEAASTYTGLTEAIYQKVQVFIVVMSKGEKADFWSFCTGRHFVVRTKDDFSELAEMLFNTYEKIKFEPMVIEVVMDYHVNRQAVDENLILSIGNYLDKSDTVSVSNMHMNFDVTSLNFNVTVDNGEYGIISKYIGYIWRSVNINILICTSRDLYLDINTFNCKYISSKLKVFVYDVPGYIFNIQEWIEANSITYISINRVEHSVIKDLIESDNPILVHVKRG